MSVQRGFADPCSKPHGQTSSAPHPRGTKAAEHEGRRRPVSSIHILRTGRWASFNEDQRILRGNISALGLLIGNADGGDPVLVLGPGAIDYRDMNSGRGGVRS